MIKQTSGRTSPNGFRCINRYEAAVLCALWLTDFIVRELLRIARFRKMILSIEDEINEKGRRNGEEIAAKLQGADVLSTQRPGGCRCGSSNRTANIELLDDELFHASRET
jgi:hypothetical protein